MTILTSLFTAVGAFYWIVKQAVSELHLDDDQERIEAQYTAKATLQRLEESSEHRNNDNIESAEKDASWSPRRKRIQDLQLNRYELMIASDVIAPDQVHVSFSGISTTSELIRTYH